MIPYIQPYAWWIAFIALLPRPVILFINTAAIVSISIRVLKQLSELSD